MLVMFVRLDSNDILFVFVFAFAFTFTFDSD